MKSHPVSLIALILLVLPAGCKPSRTEPGRATALDEGTSVLLITLDTTRADRLGCYGYAAAATPTLDQLSDRGVLFERALSQVPLTLPSHASILTGRYPKELGVRVNGREAMGSTHATLAGEFRAHGYSTAAIVAAGVVDSRYGLDRGFDVYLDDFEAIEEGAKDDAQRRGDSVTDDALAWLNTVSNKPFFAWVHYYDPHDPYDPPAPFNTDHAISYDGEIAFMDTQIKRLVDWLEGHQLRGRTLVVVVGDHGESFGEHGTNGHTTFLYETNLHVPLIFSHPALQQSHRVDAVVETVDVLPTVVGLMGWQAPDGLLARSLGGALRGDPIESVESYAECHQVNWAFGWAEQRSLTTRRWKYISSTIPELFDHTADPDERRSIIGEYPKVAEQMREALQARLAQMAQGKPAAVTLDENGRRLLESLGYVSGGTAAESGEFLTPDLPDPKNMLAVIRLTERAQRAMKLGYSEQAVDMLAQAAPASPKSMSIHYLLGLANRKLERHDAAVAAFDDALRLDPKYTPALNAMAKSLSDLGRRDEAIDYFRASLALDEQNANIHRRLAGLLRSAGKVEESLIHLERAIAIDPQYVAALSDLGEVYGQRGDHDRAIAYSRRAVAVDPDRHDSSVNLAILLTRAGRTEEAVALYQRILTIDQGNEHAVTFLVNLYLSTKRVSETVNMLRAALPHAPNSLAILKPLASLLATAPDAAVRDGALAVELAQRAVTLTDRRDAVALATLAAAHAETGAFDQAVEVATEAVELARARGATRLAEIIELQLTGYHAGKPFRDGNL